MWNYYIFVNHSFRHSLLLHSILMLLNKRELEKLKERWWKNDEVQSQCQKPEDQSDGISIQNIGGVFIVIFVGIAMACVTLIFEYWWYRYRKNPQIGDMGDQGTRNATNAANAFLDRFDILRNKKQNFGKFEKSSHHDAAAGGATEEPSHPGLRTRIQHFPDPSTKKY